MKRIRQLINSGTPFTFDGRTIRATVQTGASRSARRRSMRQPASASYGDEMSLQEAYSQLDQSMRWLDDTARKIQQEKTAFKQRIKDMKALLDNANSTLNGIFLTVTNALDLVDAQLDQPFVLIGYNIFHFELPFSYRMPDNALVRMGKMCEEKSQYPVEYSCEYNSLNADCWYGNDQLDPLVWLAGYQDSQYGIPDYLRLNAGR